MDVVSCKANAFACLEGILITFATTTSNNNGSLCVRMRRKLYMYIGLAWHYLTCNGLASNNWEPNREPLSTHQYGWLPESFV